MRTVKPYDITNGEKVTYGSYSALEAVFRLFLSKLETHLYDELNLSFDFDFKIAADTRFSQYLETFTHPAPIFIFNLNPLMRDSILKTDNRFINLVLSKKTLYKEGKVALNNRFSITERNSSIVKSAVEKILDLFESCWAKVHEVNCNLKGLVSNKIKAKVMDGAESCIIVSVCIKQKQFVSNWNFCFSTYQLDRIIEKRGSKGLLAASGALEQDQRIKTYFKRLLLEQSSYEIKGVLGALNLTSNELITSFKNRSVIPLINQVRSNAVVHLNDTPILAATVGETDGQVSLKIENSFSQAASDPNRSIKQFSKLKFKKE